MELSGLVSLPQLQNSAWGMGSLLPLCNEPQNLMVQGQFVGIKLGQLYQV